MKTNKSIISAAIKLKNGKVFSLPSPNRHYNIVLMLNEKFGNTWQNEHTKGFLDSEGNFVTRSEAYQIAKLSNQIVDTDFDNQGMLYTSDLW